MKMATQRAKLTSIRSGNEIFELLCENGQILPRGLPGKRQMKPWHSSHQCSSIADTGIGGDIFPSKRARFETRDSLQDEKHDEPKLYRKSFNLISEPSRGILYNKNPTDFQVVPTNENANLEPEFAPNNVVEIPRLETTRNSQQRYQASGLVQQNIESAQNLVSLDELHDRKLQRQDLEPEGERARVVVNFPLFRRSAAVVEVHDQSRDVTILGLSRAEDFNYKDEIPIVPDVVPSANDLKSVDVFQNKKSLKETDLELVKQSSNSPDISHPDDQSANVCCEGLSEQKRSTPYQVLYTSLRKGKQNTGKAEEPTASSSSFCSNGASNNPAYTLNTTYEDTWGLPHQNIEEKAGCVKKPVPACGSIVTKRRRTADSHNSSEKRQRKKINKKISALKEHIPNCTKVDKTSILDDAIAYLKVLQLQIQIMSMGTGLFMPPMMQPHDMKQMHVPHINHFAPMGAGLGLRTHMGIGCTPTQFLFSPIPMSVVNTPMGFNHKAVSVPGFSQAATSSMDFKDSAPPSFPSDHKQPKY